MYDTLVISGGSVKGFGLLGAIEKIIEEVNFKNINCFVGTSIGSIIGYLLAINYTPLEIIHSLYKSSIFEKLRKIEVLNILNSKGIFNFNPIIDELQEMTLKKHNKLFTMKSLYEELDKELICVTFNYTKNKMEIIEHIHYPDIPCLVAIRMSSSIPFVFDRFYWNNCIYVDGGICDNFPIRIAKKYGKINIIGVVIKTEEIDLEKNDNNSLINFLSVLVFHPIIFNTNYTIKKFRKKCKIFEIPIKCNFLNFNLSITDMMEMFSDGYNIVNMKKIL